jgi:alpha-beta hydrolase superfamily lysophospholipase
MKDWIERFPKFEPQNDAVLIIQGDQDSTVDWEYNLEQIKEKLPKAKIKIIPQARHHMVCESAPYRAQVFAAIKGFWDK